MRVSALRRCAVAAAALLALAVASLFVSYTRLVRSVETAASAAGFIDRAA